MTQSRHIRIVSLWIHPGQDIAFEAFEREAARIMARYGGRIDSAVRIRPSGAGDQPFEVHVVSFPTGESVKSYADDPETVAVRARRNGIIAKTVILEGHEAGPY